MDRFIYRKMDRYVDRLMDKRINGWIDKLVVAKKEHVFQQFII